MQTLQGRIAVVTGGTKGIGRGVARELAQRGARVFVTGRSATDSADADPYGCDHRLDEQVEAAFDRIIREAGFVDILVNNVWGGYERMVENGEFTWPKPFWAQPLWRWDAMFSAGVRAHYHAAQLAAHGMIARQRGLIVNVHRWQESPCADARRCLTAPNVESLLAMLLTPPRVYSYCRAHAGGRHRAVRKEIRRTSRSGS